MAFHFPTFKTRALTAIVFAIVMLVGLLWNQWSFIFLFTIIHFGCWWEYFKLIEKINSIKLDVVVKYFFVVMAGIILYYAAFPNVTIDVYAEIAGNRISLKYLFIGFLILLLMIFISQNKQVPQQAKWMSFMGFIYITMPIVMMIHLYFVSVTYHISLHTYFPVIPAAIIFSIWINDTMAYIVGSLIGKTPFSKISAKKTWEGTIGGAVLCIVIMAFFGLWNKQYSTADKIIIPALCAIFGTLGDLVESKLKRLAGVKDSGTIMPGHGGFLDRFDSLLIATPFVWLYVYFFMR